MASMIRGSRVDHGAVVLFDGTCAFCEGTVKFIATRDPQGYFRFGASQTDKVSLPKTRFLLQPLPLATAHE
jgi:predicted DCC family thiol-disulfide oxidoreductase YuxK